jgi:hypothetical protein
MPEGEPQDPDQDDEDEDACPKPADILREKTEDLGDE